MVQQAQVTSLEQHMREAGIATVRGRIRRTLESPLYTCVVGPHVRRVRGFAGTGKVFFYLQTFYLRAQNKTSTRAHRYKMVPVSSP